MRALGAISALQAKHPRKTDFLSMAKEGQTRPPMVKRPMRISELAEELEIPQSSASVLVRTLIQRGYMDFSPPGARCLPHLAWEFGSGCNSWRNGSMTLAPSSWHMPWKARNRPWCGLG